jgi:SAM-dependent methyltransferase
MSSPSPFVERLRQHAVAARERPPVAAVPAAPAEAVAGSAASPAPDVARDQLAFWQSPVARAAIHRRVTGDPELAPDTYMARRYGPAIAGPHIVSLRASNASMEAALVESGPAERVTGLDDDTARIDFANRRVPEPLRDRVRFTAGELAGWDPPEPVGAVVSRSALHREAELDGVLDRIQSILVPGGLVFVDEFVGPSRFQWTDAQLDVINRLLKVLPPELLVDLTASDGRLKRSVERPDPQRWAAANPREAVNSSGILPGLDARFERVEVCLYGGAVIHQLFSRIMGNFAGRPELVGLLMETDALLTDCGALESDYAWGVWRRR